jgi:hypothetical protein
LVENEASYLLKKAPVITEEFTSGAPQMPNKVATALQNYKAIMLREHAIEAGRQDQESSGPRSIMLSPTLVVRQSALRGKSH